jgi:hypothetical protein
MFKPSILPHLIIPAIMIYHDLSISASLATLWPTRPCGPFSPTPVISFLRLWACRHSQATPVVACHRVTMSLAFVRLSRPPSPGCHVPFPFWLPSSTSWNHHIETHCRPRPPNRLPGPPTNRPSVAIKGIPTPASPHWHCFCHPFSSLPVWVPCQRAPKSSPSPFSND